MSRGQSFPPILAKVARGSKGTRVATGRDLASRTHANRAYLFVFSRWNKWALSRGKRELRVSSSSPTGLADLKAVLAETIVQPQDVKGPSRGAQAR